MIAMRGAANQRYMFDTDGGAKYHADDDGRIEVEDADVFKMKQFGCVLFNHHAEKHHAGDILRK